MARSVRRKRELEAWQDPDAQPYLLIEDLCKSYDGVPVLRNINLEVYKGEFFTLLGASGCGKTTLLRILAGFDMPDRGKVYIDGKDITKIPPHERPVNMMFQSYALFPHMTVMQNVCFGLKQESLPKAEIRERAEQALKLVHMETYEKRKPSQLSGGQCQRVALARSLVKRPKLVLLDEPLAALDRQLRESTQFELVNIQERIGGTFMMVTHDQEEAMTMATRIAIMEEGRICQVGPPHEVYEYPNSRYVAEFLGNCTLFEGTVSAHDEEYTEIEAFCLEKPIRVTPPSPAPEGSNVYVALRPEKIQISRGQKAGRFNRAAGKVEDIAYLGDVSIYYVRLEDEETIVQALIPNANRQPEGEITWEDKVTLSWDASSAVVLQA